MVDAEQENPKCESQGLPSELKLKVSWPCILRNCQFNGYASVCTRSVSNLLAVFELIHEYEPAANWDDVQAGNMSDTTEGDDAPMEAITLFSPVGIQ